jgi:hypothetical protein
MSPRPEQACRAESERDKLRTDHHECRIMLVAGLSEP